MKEGVNVMRADGIKATEAKLFVAWLRGRREDE